MGLFNRKKDEKLQYSNIINNGKLAVPQKEMLGENLDEDILTSSYSGVSLYQKQNVSEIILKIFDEGLYKDEIRKYNGTVISVAFKNEKTDDDNYGMGNTDAIKFWTRG